MIPHALSVLWLIGAIYWIDVPFVRQSDQGCGAASIAMVMQYWSAKGYLVDSTVMDQTRIMSLLHSRDEEGIRAQDMSRYFRKHRFQTFVFAGTFYDLQMHIRKGRPLITALAVRGREDRLHYLVVTGVDSEQNMILVNDPATRKLSKIKRHDFEDRWKATGNWTLLAVPEK